MKLVNYREGMYPAQPDPYLISAEGRYYLYVTGTDGVHAYVSDSLAGEYEDIGVVFSLAGYKEYWAPSVIKLEGRYYMYVSFMPADEEDVHLEALHVAVSDCPEGPFRCEGRIAPPFSIDAHVVKNEEGLFLFYSVNDYEAERAGTYIVADRMTDPFTPAGAPVAVVRPTLDEEIFMRDRFRMGQHWHTIEGAFYFSEGDHHYLIYSGNCYQNERYYLGYAYAHTAERDLTKIRFQKYPNDSTYAPLIAANGFESGTGHCSVIRDQAGLFVVYHGRDLDSNPKAGEDDRTARICRLVADGQYLSAHRYEDRI